MADISTEIANFQNAVYGEDVRSSMVSLANKLNTEVESDTATVTSFAASVSDATTAANTAAALANTKAGLADTAATNANTAKTAANNAATAANSAATSATNAASAATTTNSNIAAAEALRVTAENARASAETARATAETGRVTAETSRVSAEAVRESAESTRTSQESVRQSNETARQGNEAQRQNQEQSRVTAENGRVSEFGDMQAAFADMQRTVVPQATTSTMGGVIVGDGLNVDNALLSLDMAKHGTGTSVQAGGSSLAGTTVYGESIQDGTPTPSEPVPIEVVEPINVLAGVTYNQGGIGLTGVTQPSTERIKTSLQPVIHGLSYNVSCETGYQFSARIYNANAMTSASLVFTDSEWQTSKSYDMPDDARYIAFVIRKSNNGSIAPSDADSAGLNAVTAEIALLIGDTVTPIDLQGNVLASLPDGTYDTLNVDSAGHCVLVKRVGIKKASEFTSRAYASGGFVNVEGGLPLLTSSLAIYSDMFTGTTESNANMPENSVKQTSNSVSLPTEGQIRVKNTEEFTSQEAVNTWFASHNATFAYLLAEPQTIDLGYIDMPGIPSGGAAVSVSATITPVIDASWWENGAEEVPQAIGSLYNRVITQAVNQLALSTLAPVEGDTVSANYAVGSYLVHGGTLYRVTSAIANGEAIVPETNATATTVMAELVSLTS